MLSHPSVVQVVEVVSQYFSFMLSVAVFARADDEDDEDDADLPRVNQKIVSDSSTQTDSDVVQREELVSGLHGFQE